MTRSVARLLAESLEAHDVDQIFCVPGESYVGLINALTDMNSVRLIVCRHEGGAGFMAVADGRLRSRAGCCIVSRGPGLSNSMVSLHSAYHDATPVVMLVGQVERKDFGRMALQEQNYSRLLSDVTKSVIEVIEPEQASEAIARAFHLAESGTPGPVAVILPEDIFDETTDAGVDQPRPRVLAGPRAEDLDRLADMLAKSERPLILVGGALLGDAMYDEAVFGDLRRLAEEWVLPINPTHRRPQLFDATHPHYGGYMGIRVPPALITEMKRADLMVAIGERLTDSVSQSYTFPAAPQPQLPLVHVWPDANEVGRVWRPELGIAASPHEVIKALLKRGAPAGADEAAGMGRRTACDPSQAAGEGVGPHVGRREFCRHCLRGGQASGAGCHGHVGCRQFRQLHSPVYRLQDGTDLPVIGGGRDGLRHADGGGGDAAPAGQAGGRVHGRWRRADGGQRDRDRVPVRRGADHRDLGQPDVRHDRHAPSCALSGAAVPGIDEADQSGFRGVGAFVRRRGDYDSR